MQARGSASVTGGDLAAAKQRALEDALRQAVDQAISAVVEPGAREASADVIKKRILRRARAYVVRYKVLGEGEADGVYAITVDAAVADAPLANDLAALGVGRPPAPATPAAPAEPPRPRPAPRPPLVVLSVAGDGTRTWASFGREAGGGPVADALVHELTARGFKVVPAGAADIPLSTEGTGEAPIDVAQAQALARAAGAGGALVAAGRIADGGRIRGTRFVGAELALEVRLDDAVTGSVAAAQVSAAGFGADAEAAAAWAAREAALRAGRKLAPRLEGHWPEPGRDAAGTLVHLRGVSRAADVDAIARAFTGTPGVKAVLPHGYARREVTLLVQGAAPRTLADAVTRAPPPGLQARAQATAGEVDVQLSADATLPPPIAAPQ